MNTPIGISLPNNILEQIDDARGDITRSRFILRLIEIGFKEFQSELKKIKEGKNKE
jgi:metal-responsive CopG/Arc/MetJ family transcriptional regulator